MNNHVNQLRVYFSIDVSPNRYHHPVSDPDNPVPASDRYIVQATARARKTPPSFWEFTLPWHPYLPYLGRVMAGRRAVSASFRVANDFQIYGALILSFLFLTLCVLSFIRRRPTVWLGLGLFWILGLLAILPNMYRFGEVVWQSGNFIITRERLAPTWAMLGWLVFTLAIISMHAPPITTRASRCSATVSTTGPPFSCWSSSTTH